MEYRERFAGRVSEKGVFEVEEENGFNAAFLIL